MTHSELRGFTILELMVVVSIIGVLAAMSVFIYRGYEARARGTDIVEKYGEIKTRVGVRLAQVSSDNCDDLAKMLPTDGFQDDYAKLDYGFQQAAGGGYRPVLTVCSTAEANGPLGVKVARGAHETLAKSGAVETPAVLTDSVVSFALTLTHTTDPACRVAPAAAPACGKAGTGGAATGSAGVAPVVAAGGPVQTTAGAQTGATGATGTTGSSGTTGSTGPTAQAGSTGQGAALAPAGSGSPPAQDCRLLTAAFTTTSPNPNEPCQDTFLGDCVVDFSGMCDQDFVKEVCGKTCGNQCPADPVKYPPVTSVVPAVYSPAGCNVK